MSRFVSILLLLLLLSNSRSLMGQTDSIRSRETDSLKPASPDTLVVSPDTLTPVLPDETLVPSWYTPEPDTPLYKKAISGLEAQLPEVYKDSGKLRLHIPVFWREDIDLPLPKAFEKTGGRPPYDPTVAWQRSLILPGWGQVYNQAYWKLPIFYAGYAAGAAWISYNNQLYQETRLAFLAKVSPDPFDDDPRFQSYDSEGIRTLRENFRNQRDQGILILAGWHLVQVAEAYVDAHMKGYDVSEDLSFQPFPSVIEPIGIGSPAIGLGLNFSF